MSKNETMKQMIDHEWQNIMATHGLKESDRAGKMRVYDGIVDEDTFAVQRHKTLFLLKDANKPNGYDISGAVHDFEEGIGDGYAYRDLLNTANSTVREDTKYTRLGTMWRVICMWARIVEDEGFGLTDCFDDKGYHVDDMRGYLKNIAIVNIKKTAGESSCPTTELEKAVNGYFCLIQQQIECISPSLIVCCGTFEVVRDYLKNKATDIQDYGDYFIYNGRGYLKAPHPANRRSYQTNFDEFKKVYYGMKECSLLQNI